MWKQVVGYEGLYEVSDTGEVKSLHRNIILKPQANRYGYLMVTLSKNGVTKGVTIHGLVAKAFIDNPQGFPEVNHKDEDKTNNCVSNLEWCTHRENLRHGTAARRIGDKLSKPAKMVYRTTGEELVCVSQSVVCDLLGCSKGHMWKALKKGYSIYGWGVMTL